MDTTINGNAIEQSNEKQPNTTVSKPEPVMPFDEYEMMDDEIYQGTGKRLRKAAELNSAQRSGVPIVTFKKAMSGINKQHRALRNGRRLSEETEKLDHERISLSVGKIMQQARQAKNLTQKDLAFRINEKVHVVADHENGKAVPNYEILMKMERVLGVRLRKPRIGEPLTAPGSKMKQDQAKK